VQDVRAVGEHRRKGLPGIEPSLVHLGDVGDDVGFDVLGERGGAAARLIQLFRVTL